MQLITFFCAILLSFFSTVVMSYISMATGIGPWIETTVVLVGMLIFLLVQHWYSAEVRSKALGLVAGAGGIGGILATACGFSFPTLYFLDPVGFAELMAQPLYFAALLSVIAFAAGSFGLIVAHFFEESLLIKQAMPFPIGELVYKMITAADNMAKAVMLAAGFVGTFLFLWLRTAFVALSKPLILLEQRALWALTIPRVEVPTDQLPMFWAIGFVTGHVIAVPLLVGLLSKIFVIEPLHYAYPYLSKGIYEYLVSPVTGWTHTPQALSSMDFTIAFCSGLVLYGAFKGFLELPHVFKNTFDKLTSGKTRMNSISEGSSVTASFWYAAGLVLVLNVVILSLFSFSLIQQLYLLLFTIICTYQLMLLAGKFGLAPLGRFATFVLVPGLLMFGYNALQITSVALYVEVAGGVACDALFGRKMAQLASIESRSIIAYQWLGLVVSAGVIGIVTWAFVSHFGLGPQVGALAATRSASRALLISVKSFDGGALLGGLLFGHVVSFFKVSPPLLLGGILMPISYTLMLVGGGLSTALVDKKEEYYPFWSGVFASNSLWMLLRAFI